MHELEIENYNQWYSKNYHKLLKWADRHRIEYDTVNDSYIKIIERINKVGFQGNFYMTYTKLSIKNFNINNLKKNRNIYFVDTDDKDWTITIENILQDFDEMCQDNILYQEELMYFSKNLFQFLSTRNYSDEEMFVFKSYFLFKGRMTYEKLTEITNINKNRLTKIITTMKTDIKNNLLNYIKDEQSRNS